MSTTTGQPTTRNQAILNRVNELARDPRRTIGSIYVQVAEECDLKPRTVKKIVSRTNTEPRAVDAVSDRNGLPPGFKLATPPSLQPWDPREAFEIIAPAPRGRADMVAAIRDREGPRGGTPDDWDDLS